MPREMLCTLVLCPLRNEHLAEPRKHARPPLVLHVEFGRCGSNRMGGRQYEVSK